MSAVAKLAAQLQRQTPRVIPMHYTVTAADARELLQLIESLCPDHGRCQSCGSQLCPTCDVDCRCEIAL